MGGGGLLDPSPLPPMVLRFGRRQRRQRKMLPEMDLRRMCQRKVFVGRKTQENFCPITSGGRGLAQGLGSGLFAFGGAYWPLVLILCGSERVLVVSTEPLAGGSGSGGCPPQPHHPHSTGAELLSEALGTDIGAGVHTRCSTNGCSHSLQYQRCWWRGWWWCSTIARGEIGAVPRVAPAVVLLGQC